MANVNFFPVIGKEKTLPVFCQGIGINHEQEPHLLLSHKNDCIHFHMTVSGCGIANFNGKNHLLPIGTMMYTPHNKCVNIMPTPGGWKNNWVLINIENLTNSRFLSLGDEVTIFTPNKQSEFIKIFENISRNLLNNTLEGRIEASAESYKFILYAIAELESGCYDNLSENLIIEDAINYISNHLSSKIMLNNLCNAKKHITPQYFCRLFKKYTDMRPTEYIRKMRIEYAKQLLVNTDMSICDIASNCGFESTTYFYRCWKQLEKGSPLEFRKQHRGVYI